MIVDRIELVGFGRLSDRALDFHPRVNVICGPNEAGKSTLLEAIHALLYGLFDGGNAREHNQKKARFRPWTGGPYGGTLHVRLASGDRYRLVRDFAVESTRIYQDPGATDRTSAYGHKHHGWISFADDHLGLSLPVFRACAHVDQAALLFEKSDVAALKDRLERLADSAGTESSAQEAARFLEELLRERVNPRGFTANRSPLKKAQDDVARLREELDRSRELLASLESLAVEERSLAGELAMLRREQDSIEAALARHDLRDLEDKLARLRALDEQIAALGGRLDALADVASLHQEGLDRAKNALEDVERANRALGEAQDVVDREGVAREGALRERDEVERQIAGLAEVESERLTEAEEAITRWRDAERDLTSAGHALEQSKARLNPGSSADSLLIGLPELATTDSAAEAVRSAESTLRMVQLAEDDAARAAVVPEIDEEFATLDKRLEGLTPDRLEDLRQRDRQISLAEVARPRPSSPSAPLVGVLAGLVGLAAGWFAFGLVGALVGAIALAAIGFALGARLQSANAPDASSQIAKSRPMLVAELATFGVATVGDLQRVWDRRAEIGGDVQRARERRALVVERRLEHERSLDGLERLVGTRDVGRAGAILTAMQRSQAERQSASAALRQAEERFALAERTLAATKQGASIVLSALGITTGDLPLAQERLASLRREQFERSALRQHHTEVEAAIRGFAEHLASVDLARQRLAEAQEEARRSLAAVGADGSEFEWNDRLAGRLERFREYQRLQQKRQEHVAAREALVGSDDPNLWQRQRDALRRRGLVVPEGGLGQADNPAVPPEERESTTRSANSQSDSTPGADLGDTRTRDELRQQRAGIASRRDDVTRQLADAQAQRNATLQGVREPAAIEEELDEAERTLAQLERLQRALEDARDLLRRVGEEHRRNFAPRLADGVGDALARATANRYREVDVDPTDLKVRVRSAERVEPVAVDELSHGTRDAVWLLLRATVVDLLSDGGEPVPLFFDDPLVHVDPARCERLLDLIQHLSEDRQVFYFTQDLRVVNWARACTVAAIHDLERISGV